MSPPADPRRPARRGWAQPRLAAALALWLLGSALALAAARVGIGAGLGTALAAGLVFGLAAGRRVDHRRLRVARRKAP